MRFPHAAPEHLFTNDDLISPAGERELRQFGDCRSIAKN
jgi:hypothetical protein